MQGVNIPYTQNTPYINTIPANEEKKSTEIKILKEEFDHLLDGMQQLWLLELIKNFLN
jgi:pyruvate dehydrogenase complex dehydrogenase (E1) component